MIMPARLHRVCFFSTLLSLWMEYRDFYFALNKARSSSVTMLTTCAGSGASQAASQALGDSITPNSR